MTRRRIHKFDPSDQRRPRRLEESSTAEVEFPLVFVIIGGLAGLIVLGLVGLGVVNIMRQDTITPTPTMLPALLTDGEPAAANETPDAAAPQDEGDAAANPTPIVPTSTPDAPTPTPEPTVPQQIEVGAYVVVANTGGAGVRVRPGPRRNAEDAVQVAPEETLMLVLDGPNADQNQEDYIWWNVRLLEEGTEGWVVEDFIAPAAAP